MSKGLFNGITKTEFDPDGSFTRGMFVAVLSRLDGVSLTDTMTGFDDVDAGAYYAKAVKWASDNEIVYGTSDVRFSPDDPITRQDAAAIFGRYFTEMEIELTANKESSVFADDDSIAGYAKEWVYKMQISGIIYGKNGNTFDPNGLTTRAEAATLFLRIDEAK